ncbi:MAG TPA: gluconeogenesis factor YvcK family protein, partial [Candidatus Eremiobacteraceae bacterium]|nr:gluconeogenesis factor YvcK family protein [Candidatus Eremiobacteraceae bacterium]
MWNGATRNVETPPQVRRFLTWLRPGMKLKRWLALALFGAFLVLDGFGRILKAYDFNFHINERINSLIGPSVSPVLLEVTLIVAGLALAYYGFRQYQRSIIAAISPSVGQRLIEVIHERRQLDRGNRLVVIGGGTGLSTALRGLKEYTTNLTAIVTVTDDGGSSGRLRAELGVLPPGDIRNCLVALADSESMMAELFQYRFNEGDGLVGHSFGNLFIAAMCGIAGDFDRAIKESSRVLAIKGRVLPSTLANIALEATLADGSTVKGETKISKSSLPIRRLRLVPSYCQALPEAVEAILAADVVILGPGSLYTSIMPNLLVPGIAEAIERSKATKVFVCNIMTQPGETTG